MTAEITRTKAKVLVVEDEANVREMIRHMLEPEGYQVQVGADGLEGLRAFFSWQPDLVDAPVKN
jgi:two-component system OmpR family response regulator